MFQVIKADIEAPSHANTSAVVVLFHPEGDLLGRLKRVLSQVSRLIVVSNDGQGPQRLVGLDATLITHVQAKGNLGLAAALNQGLSEAAKNASTWCLLLDQDTEVDSDLVAGLGEAFLSCPRRDSIGLLAPNYRSLGGRRLAYPSNCAWQVLETAVTSGSLVAISAVQKVGGMRDAFFIEGIDIEFSLRLRAAGLQLVASGRPLMTHGAGMAEERRLLGRFVLVGHHPPWRCFLQFRNLAWTLWRYRHQEPRWARSSLGSMCKRFCLVFLFEQQRLRKAWAMLHGTIVGFIQAMQKDKMAIELPILK